MNTQEIAWAEELSRRLANLEKNQANFTTLLSKIHRLEFKQANLINDIKKLKPNALENHIDATYRKRLIPIEKIKIETYLTINP